MLSPLQDCAATIEALIFASDRPIRERELIVHVPDNMDLAEVIAAIALRYDATSGIELCQVGDGWAFRTKAEIAERLSQHKQVERPLSRAALGQRGKVAVQPVYVGLTFRQFRLWCETPSHHQPDIAQCRLLHHNAKQWRQSLRQDPYCQAHAQSARARELADLRQKSGLQLWRRNLAAVTTSSS